MFWKKSNFKNINLKGMTENLKIHLNSYAWSAKLVADNMKKKKIKHLLIGSNNAGKVREIKQLLPRFINVR